MILETVSGQISVEGIRRRFIFSESSTGTIRLHVRYWLINPIPIPTKLNYTETLQLVGVGTSERLSFNFLKLPHVRFFLSGDFLCRRSDSKVVIESVLPLSNYTLACRKVAYARRYTPKEQLSEVIHQYDFVFEENKLVLGTCVEVPNTRDDLLLISTTPNSLSRLEADLQSTLIGLGINFESITKLVRVNLLTLFKPVDSTPSTQTIGCSRLDLFKLQPDSRYTQIKLPYGREGWKYTFLLNDVYFGTNGEDYYLAVKHNAPTVLKLTVSEHAELTSKLDGSYEEDAELLKRMLL